MPKPKYVIIMGACTITGGMFSTNSYNTVREVDKLIPIDVSLPNCPPKSKTVLSLNAILNLSKTSYAYLFLQSLANLVDYQSFCVTSCQRASHQ